MKQLLAAMQQLGRALMLPIAVLPVAGLLLRLGQPDLLNLAPMASAGDAIFANLGLLFAIGVAVGLARENNGAAGLAAVVGFLVATKGAEVLIQVPPGALNLAPGVDNALAVAAYKSRELAKLSVPIGILSGVIAGWLYNRYSNIRLPSYLAFFAGRRFVPIASGFVGLLVAFVFGYGWPVLEAGMDSVSHGILGAGSAGLFAYGVLNRLLIITGLHHIINNVAWFLVGDFHGVTGDLKRFFAGDPSAGFFMSGFFPVMMFGLPAACLAMYRTARPERRKETGGLLMSMGLTSFLTGVTEPIEFTFMFLAPVLFVVHALLTGTAMVVMSWIDSRLGFSFSAGLFDYVLNFKTASHPLYLLPVGAVYFGLYYTVFHYFIVRFDLKTPGREDLDAADLAANAASAADVSSPAARFVVALGGRANLVSVDACTTRLRLAVGDANAIDEAALKRLGSRGVLRLSSNSLQVVLGPVADQVAGDIRDYLAASKEVLVDMPRTVASTPTLPQASPDLAGTILAAVGGAKNLLTVEGANGRLLLTLADSTRMNTDALASLPLHGVAQPRPGSVHLLMAGNTTTLADSLRRAN